MYSYLGFYICLLCLHKQDSIKHLEGCMVKEHSVYMWHSGLFRYDLAWDLLFFVSFFSYKQKQKKKNQEDIAPKPFFWSVIGGCWVHSIQGFNILSVDFSSTLCTFPSR